MSVNVWGGDRLLFRAAEVDPRAVDRIAEAAQVRAMAHTPVRTPGHTIDGCRDIAAAPDAAMEAIERHGLDAVQTEPIGELAASGIFEFAAMLDRLRGLRTVPSPAAAATPPASPG